MGLLQRRGHRILLRTVSPPESTILVGHGLGFVVRGDKPQVFVSLGLSKGGGPALRDGGTGRHETAQFIHGRHLDGIKFEIRGVRVKDTTWADGESCLGRSIAVGSMTMKNTMRTGTITCDPS